MPEREEGGAEGKVEEKEVEEKPRRGVGQEKIRKSIRQPPIGG